MKNETTYSIEVYQGAKFQATLPPKAASISSVVIEQGWTKTRNPVVIIGIAHDGERITGVHIGEFPSLEQDISAMNVETETIVTEKSIALKH